MASFFCGCLLLIFSFSTVLANDSKKFKHSLDFSFVWGDDLGKYREFTAKIADEQFAGKNFGPQGGIDEKYDWERKVISYAELQERLIHTISTLRPSVKEALVARAKGGLIDDILGTKKEYNVLESLKFLRDIEDQNKNSEMRLLQRILSLTSYDALNAESIAKQNISKIIYNDLNFTDKTILPSARQSGVANFVSFCLYQDENRRVRIHIVKPTTSQNSEFPHDHYGSSASSILAGALVNQHIAVIPAKYSIDAHFGLYLLTRTSFTGPREKQTKVSFFQTNVKLGVISSHLYKAGDSYFLPGPREVQSDLTVNDILTFHRIGTGNYAVTLFTQQMSGTTTHTTYEVGASTIIYKQFDDALLSYEESIRLASEIDKLIRGKA